jgi:myosin V
LEGEDAINPGVFWLSNVLEMLSFVCVAESELFAPVATSQMDDLEWQEYDRLVSIVKHDFESLQFNIYHTWMKQLKTRLHKMIIPAVIESQSLPGFITNDGNRFFNKLLQNSGPQYSMDDLINLLNKVYKAMKAYYLEESIIQQASQALLKLVGVTAFNDLLMRYGQIIRV